jgi:hypothetical protein
MTIENQIRAFAGAFVLAGLALAYFASPYFLWAVAFVGANLFQSAFTKFCPLEIVLRKFEGADEGAPHRQQG